MSPFDILFGMTKGKLYSRKDVEQNLSQYLLLQYITSNRVLVNIAEYLQQNYKNIGVYEMYLFILNILPKQISYIPWTKKEKPNVSDNVKLLQKHYFCSEEVAKKYEKLLSKEQFEKIERLYRYGKNKINR